MFDPKINPQIHPQTSDFREQQREEVPWSVKDTFNGVFFTLAPWLLITALLSQLGSGASSSQPITFRLDLIQAGINLIFALIVEGAFLVAPLYYSLRAKRPPVLDLRSVWQMLGFRRFAVGRTAVLIIGLLISVFFVNWVYQVLIDTFHLNLQTNDQVLLERGRQAPISTYVTLVAAVFLAPFCEEVFFRSFVLMGFLKGMSVPLAIALSALVFGAAHGDLASFPVLVFIGAALGFLRWYTRSFWPGFILHLLNNGVSALLLVLTMNGVIKM